MKLFKVYLLACLFSISLVLLNSCVETDSPVAQDTTVNKEGNTNVQLPTVNPENMLAEFNKRFAEHQNMLAKRGYRGKKDRNKADITVPDDYATIQEAVDNAAEGDKIKVKSGEYTEEVIVGTADLEIKAWSKVTLNGSFSITANNVKIEGFKILIPSGLLGISTWGISGAKVQDNTFSGGYAGVFIWESDNIKVHGNKITGASDFGITIGNSTNCKTSDNKCWENAVGGIIVNSWVTPDISTNNTVEDNYCYNNVYHGIFLGNSENCKIKENKTTNNGQYGIIVTNGALNNRIEKNKAYGNGLFDIILHGSAGTGNIFSRNRAGTTSGF